MKIAFVGKGGSGKTTLSSLVIQSLAENNKRVFAIDSDINQHLIPALGLAQQKNIPPPSLGVEITRLQKFLRNKNSRITSTANFIRTTPPATGSRLIRPFEKNELFNYFARDINGIRLCVVGQPPDDQIGKKCYHANMGAVSMLLNHMIDARDEYVVVDLTAGIDTIISGMFVSYDIVFVVVEPTLQSLSVFTDYLEYSRRAGSMIPIVPIANKILQNDDLAFIEQTIGQTPVACIGHSPFIRSLERGVILPFSEIEPQTRIALEKIVSTIDAQQKNWQQFYNNLIAFHTRKAQGNNNISLLNQIDPDFDITKVVELTQ